MTNSNKSLLVIGLCVVVVGGILGKLAIDNRLPLQNPGVSSDISKAEATEKALADGAVDTEAVESQQKFKITFPEALQIAENKIDGKAFSMERETEDGKAVIEVAIGGQEVFVDAENGEIVSIDDLYKEGDLEDIEEITEALELQKLAVITIQEALEAAENFAGGKAHTVEIENEEGNLVYEVVIGLQEVYVDAGNGQVLYTEKIGKKDEDEIDDSLPKSSIQVPFTEDDDSEEDDD